MKRNTIKWRIFKYNLIVIIILISVTTVIFNVAVRFYIENDIKAQLNKIVTRTEEIALRNGPDFFPMPGQPAPGRQGQIPPLPRNNRNNDDDNELKNELYRYLMMLDRSLREPLSVLNADYLLLDLQKNRISLFPEEFYSTSARFSDAREREVESVIKKSKGFYHQTYVKFNLAGAGYMAIIEPVFQKNSFGLGWIVVYSSLEKVNQLQWVINLILFCILIFAAVITVIFSSRVSNKISTPFSALNGHIRAIAERNFATKIQLPVDDELRDFVNNINLMSDKLETYDQAQKTFLQNVSHEFRTPLMSIQSYAEGLKYEVVDSGTAANVIIEESLRMTHLVEDLLYLSRLESIEENYHFEELDLNEILKGCLERLQEIARKSNIHFVTLHNLEEKITIYADEEKLSRAILNILSNGIRYASTTVTMNISMIESAKVRLTIADDGLGFEAHETSKIFDRFYKGKKGNFGLGLAISKNVIEKHQGLITAENTPTGAMFNIELPLKHPHQNPK